jgi:hypothetical protein
MIASSNLEQAILRKRLPGLFDFALAGKYQSRKDQGLRLGAALGEAAIDEELVGALLCHGFRIAGAKRGEKRLQIVQSQCLPLQLRMKAGFLNGFRERNGSRIQEETKMRIMETAATSFVALAAQVLVVATILI